MYQSANSTSGPFTLDKRWPKHFTRYLRFCLNVTYSIVTRVAEWRLFPHVHVLYQSANSTSGPLTLGKRWPKHFTRYLRFCLKVTYPIVTRVAEWRLFPHVHVFVIILVISQVLWGDGFPYYILLSYRIVSFHYVCYSMRKTIIAASIVLYCDKSVCSKLK